MADKVKPGDTVQYKIVDEQRCDYFVEKLDLLKPQWLPRFDDFEMWTLGAASYLDLPGRLNNGQLPYYETAEKYNVLLIENFYELLEGVRVAIEDVVQAPAHLADRYALPGFHIFETTAIKEMSAEVPPHFDTQYRKLDHSKYGHAAGYHLDQDTLSFTLPIQLPRQGGGLRTWDVDYIRFLSMIPSFQKNTLEELTRTCESTIHPYTLGTVTIHSGHTLHRAAEVEHIEKGDRRITLQGFVIRYGDAWYLYW